MTSDSAPKRNRGGARIGAGRPRLRDKTTRLPSISILALHRAGRIPPTAHAIALPCHGTTLSVQIARTPCHLGGSRPWFVCPHCLDRAGVLYQRTEPALEVTIHGCPTTTLPQRHRLSCRRCLCLQYPSQAETVAQRSARRSRKLRTKLAGGSKLVKPKWMRWPTFERLTGELVAEEMLRAEITALAESGMPALDAGIRSEIALAATNASQLSDAELIRTLIRLRRCEARR